MDAAAAGAFAAAGLDPAAFGGIEYFSAGVPVNIKGNQLPQAPNYKFSAGVQYTARLGGGGMSLVPRVDLAYTGESYGSIFNGNVNRRSEEHTSELQSLMRISYAVFCLKKK